MRKITYFKLMLLAIIIMAGSGSAWGQTSYLGLDGGFEGTATIDNTNVQSLPQVSKWTKANVNQTIAIETSIVRSGNNSLRVNNSTTTGRRVWSPNFTVSSTTSQVTVQYYKKVVNIVNSQEDQPGIINNTEGQSGSYNSYPSVANTWVKVTYSKTSSTFTTISGLFSHRQIGTGGDMFIDDMCLYTGAVDIISPDAPTSSIIDRATSSLNVSWTSPGTGVDGGGYLVVRGTTDPTTTPNINGIYAVGNPIGGGTVVYQGNLTNFTDNGLSSSSSYYYRIYTYDKAYNYSTALTAIGTTLSASTDNYRSKASGNWSDITSWESSSDNINWISASLIPTSAAASILIQTNHLITINANATANSLTINSGAKLTLNSGINLNVTNFNVLSDPTGTGTFVDLNPGEFTATNTNVQLYMNSARNWYISSPTSNFLVPAGYTFFKYDEPGNNLHTPITSPETVYWESVTPGASVYFPKGIGYLAQTSGASTINFTGSLNTDDANNIPITRTGTNTYAGFNLVGNPYPSYIDISTWGTDDNTSIEATYWYRSKNGNYVFDTHNLPSGITTSNSGFSATNLIPPMQAFWVRKKAVGSGTISFSNAKRRHQDDINNKFRAPAENVSQQVLRMKVSNGTTSDEAVLYFNRNASNNYDTYDSPKMSNASAAIPEIYTMAGSEELVINGMNSIPSSDIPLGFRTGESKNFTIKASEIKNFDTNTRIILKDKLLSTEKDITDGSEYSFTSDAVNSTSRFILIFKSGSVINGLDNNSVDSNAITVYKNAQNRITINCSNGLSGQGDVSVYNTIGEKLASQALTSTTTVLNKTFTSGVYLVRVTANGKTTTSKIILN
jgi:hypothetical protein